MAVKKARCNQLLSLQLEMQQEWYQTLHGKSMKFSSRACQKIMTSASPAVALATSTFSSTALAPMVKTAWPYAAIC